MRRKALFLALVLVPLLTACGGPDRPGPSPTTAVPRPVERTTITFACYDYELGSYQDLARQFEETQPGVAVQVLSIDEILGPDSGESPPEEAALRVMSAADTARWFVTPQESQRGLFRDLSPFIEEDVTFQPEDYFPGLLEAFHWQGGTWSLPAGGELSLLFFDQDAFDEAGEPYPETGNVGVLCRKDGQSQECTSMSHHGSRPRAQCAGQAGDGGLRISRPDTMG